MQHFGMLRSVRKIGESLYSIYMFKFVIETGIRYLTYNVEDDGNIVMKYPIAILNIGAT